MLRFFRDIRRRLIMPDNVRKYLIYAVGEIFLVVIGILIALQINNWNEAKKKEILEITMLQELVVALERDSSLVADYFEPRMQVKELAIDTLLAAIEEEEFVNRDRLHSLYSRLNVDFSYRFNAGPYEAIKSNGLDLISNKSLRESVSGMYETTLPAFKGFIEIVYDESIPIINELEPDFVTNKIEQHNGEWHNHLFPIDDAMLQSESFYRVLGLQIEMALNNRDRINEIEELTAGLRSEIREELRERGY